jgi:hypothetical protein
MSVVELVDEMKVNVKERHIREESKEKRGKQEEKEEGRKVALKDDC